MKHGTPQIDWPGACEHPGSTCVGDRTHPLSPHRCSGKGQPHLQVLAARGRLLHDDAILVVHKKTHVEEDLLRMECCTRAPLERFKRTGDLWQAVAPCPGEKMWLLPALVTGNPIYQGASWSSIPWTNDLFTQGICSLPKASFHLHERGVMTSSALSCKHPKPQPKAIEIQI